MKVDLYLSLGSNSGDKKGYLKKALSLLDEAFGRRYIALSDFIETEPWGFEAEEKFVNAAVLYEIDLKEDYNAEEEALRILAICKEVERKLGRTGNPQYDSEGKRIYTSRTIDVDILLLGEESVDCEQLTIPHKLMYERDFVMIPLSQIRR